VGVESTGTDHTGSSGWLTTDRKQVLIASAVFVISLSTFPGWIFTITDGVAGALIGDPPNT